MTASDKIIVTIIADIINVRKAENVRLKKIHLPVS